MQAEKPKVSVIVPVLHEEAYVAHVLSRLNEVRPPVETIVVDGGSRDRTVDVAKQFTGKVYRINRRGISTGRNYGARKASGQVLVFLDADVTVPLDFVKSVLKTFEDAAVVGATCNIMPRRFRPGVVAFFLFYNKLIQACANFKPHSRGEFFAVRRRAFVKLKGFDESMPCLEDHEFAYRLSKLGKFVFIKDLTVYESLRRFRKLGFWRVMATWLLDYVSFLLRGKPMSVAWQPVR